MSKTSDFVATRERAPANSVQRPLTICLVSSELLGWGAAGGFGFATRAIGKGLVHRGHRVFVVIPQPRGKNGTRFELDGITILAFPRRRLLQSKALFREADADIYHSQEPSVSTFLAQQVAPDRAHLVTCRDPRNFADWRIEFNHPTFTKLRMLPTFAFYENPATYLAVRRSNLVAVPSRCLIDKVRRKYRLQRAPVFLPTPIRIPTRTTKASTPTVCYVGRLDRRKRPEYFLDLARRFPKVTFLVAGSSQDPAYEASLKTIYGNERNLHFLGFIDQFTDPRLSEVFEKAWVMVNTSAREGLPNSFIEAAAHGCAIVSEVDPDGFTSRFGIVAHGGAFAEVLPQLLEDKAWQTRGAAGHAYVATTNAPDLAIDAHLKYYYRVLAEKPLGKN